MAANTAPFDKTPEQLETEIQYYLAVLGRTKSADRQARARTAIRVRTEQLAAARRVERRP